ncbi:MAG TPA: azurin [Steroidobacteraceae bacterium]|jgi:azurin|nr:azurin [Steroidobacteraceae bacterium]
MKLTRTTLLAAALLAGNAFLFTAPAHAADKVCKLEITGNDLMQYDKKEMTVAKDCTTVEVTLKHVGKLPAASMGHNWTLVKPADANGVANDGLSAGLANNYIKPGDTRVIAHTKVIGGGQSDTVTFPTSKLKAGESYEYLCTFPGHSALMKGTLKFG